MTKFRFHVRIYLLNDIEDEYNVGNLNPLRYRGYCYDAETGLYYLGTRYYDPETGRFISQDSIEYANPQSINGLNLYAYCGNNPVMYVDPDGTKPKWWQWALFGVGVALVAAAGIILTVASGGTATGLIGAIVVGAAKGALIGASIGTIAGIAGGAIYAGVTGADMGQSILSGFLMGFGIGAVVGAVIGGAAGAVSYTPSGLSRTAVKKAVKETLSDTNKMSHIMQPKHKLPNSIKEIGKLMSETLLNGKIEPYKTVKTAIWSIANSQVTFTILDGIIKISNMWIRR